MKKLVWQTRALVMTTALALGPAVALAADPPGAPAVSVAAKASAAPTTTAPTTTAAPVASASASAAPGVSGAPAVSAAPAAPAASAAAAAPAAPATTASTTARVLFDAGSKAYAARNFRAAIQAFEQAYGVEARPGLLFSIAQAHRRQYKVDGRPGHVAVAIRRYKEYLVALKTGGRRADAEAALEELAPVAQRLEQDGQLQLGSQDTESATRLIVTSAAAGAKIVVDDEKAAREAPLIVETTPGRHKIRVFADNHFEESREIEVASGAVTALDLTLKEKPATLSIASIGGARVSLDGRYLGETPLPERVEIPSGRHQIQIARLGYTTYTSALDVTPGQKVAVSAPLAMTLPRKVSIGLMTGGGAAIAGGIVLGGLALASQADAASTKGAMDRGEVVCRGATCPELDRYNSAVGARDALRATAFTLLGVGAIAGGGGLFLYLFDGLGPLAPGRTDSPAASTSAAKAKAPVGLQVSGAPVIAPGVGGVAFSGRF